MRIAAPLLALAVAACASRASDPPKAPSFRVVKSGSYGVAATGEPAGAATQPAVVVAANDADYRRAWQAYVGEGDAPAIDFSSERAVFLLLGLKRTGGYAIDVQGVTIDGGRLVVDAAVQRPAAGGISTQALTAPWSVVAVKGPAFSAATWRDRDGRELAKTP